MNPHPPSPGATPLHLGAWQRLDGTSRHTPLALPAHHLATHGVIVGKVGTGKTGLLTVMVEEALRAGIPVLAIDVKGDLSNLLLTFPSFSPACVRPWVTKLASPADPRTLDARAEALAAERQRGLESWGIHEADLAAFRARTDLRVLTPGASGGEPLHLLSSLERRSPRWDHDPDGARASLGAAVSLVLRLIGRDPDAARSKEHVLLTHLAEHRLRVGGAAGLATLLGDLAVPPILKVGEVPLERFFPKAQRHALAAALRTRLGYPTFARWRTGASLDPGAWLTPPPPPEGARATTPATIVSVAHLDEEERAMVLGMLLEELLSWVRAQPASPQLRALVVFDEVHGFLPPHPANPPTKRPLVALMKEARTAGVGVVVSTQHATRLDYRALGNAGIWCVGRQETDEDAARVIDALAAADPSRSDPVKGLGKVVKRLAPRWFLIRDAHGSGEPVLMQPRWAMAFLRGPMAPRDLRRARGASTLPSEPARLVSAQVHQGLPGSAPDREPAGQTLESVHQA